MFGKFTRYLFFVMVVAAVLNLKVIDASAANYNLWVDGVQVTDENKNNIPITSGTASYNSTNNTLSLTNAVIKNGYNVGGSSCGIASDLSYLNIVGSATISDVVVGIGMQGDGNLLINGTGTGISSTGSYDGIFRYGSGNLILEGKVTATGEVGIDNVAPDGYTSTGSIIVNAGTITAVGTDHVGIYAHNLVINGGTVISNGKKHAGIYSLNNVDIKSTITKVDAKTIDGDHGIYSNINNGIILDGSLFITKPYGGGLNDYKRIVVDSSGQYTKHVIIRPESSNDDNNNENNYNEANNDGDDNNEGGGNTGGGGNEGSNSENNPPANNGENNTPANSESNSNGNAASSENTETSHEMSLNTKMLYLKKGSTSNKVKVQLTNDEIKSVTSSNEKVATVSFGGNTLKIKGLKKGKASVIVTSNYGNVCKLDVQVQTGKVTTKSIKVSKKSLTLTKKGATAEVTVSATPDRVSTNEKIKLSVSSKKVANAKFDENTGKITITAKKKGNCKITVKAGKKTQIIKVTVKT